MLRKLKNNKGMILIENLSAFAIVCTIILIVTTTLMIFYNHQRQLKNEVEAYILLDNLVIQNEMYGDGMYNFETEMGIQFNEVSLRVIKK